MAGRRVETVGRVAAIAASIGLGTGCAELLGTDEWAPTGASTTGSGASGGAGTGGNSGAGGVGGADAPTFVWSTALGGPGDDEPNDVSSSPMGLIAVTGHGYADFAFPAGTTLLGEEGLGGWSMVFDPSGSFELFHVLYGAGDQVLEGGTYAGETLLLTGWTNMAPSFDGQSLAGYMASYDGVVIAIEDTGPVTWHRFIGDLDSQSVVGIATTSLTGDIAVGGHFEGGLSECGAATNTGEADGFVVVWNAAGTCKSQAVVPGDGTSIANTVALLPDGRVIAAGAFTGAIELANQELIVEGRQDAYVTELSGAVANWVTHFRGSGSKAVLSVSTSLDTVVAAGRFDGEMVVDGTMYTSSGAGDGFVVGYEAGGRVGWVWQMGGVGDDEVQDVHVLADGSILVGGKCTECTDLFSAGGGADGIVALLAPNGEMLWAIPIAGTGDQIVRTVTSDAAGRYVVAGDYALDAVVLGHALPAAVGGRDVFLVVLEP